jgi:site-specific DNA-methyltransferase (adenine-specific)
MIAEQLTDRVQLYAGDCMEVMASLPDCSVDSVVTDPPYHLTSIVKRFGAENAAPAKAGVYARGAKGFMGKQWDGGEIAFEPATWAAVLRVLKPGGHLCAFGAPKNFGFMQYAIAQAGFEVRDVLAWIFGSGFPKSHNVGNGWGTALKPAYEPVILARKPLIGTVAANVLAHGTGAINIDGCRVDASDADLTATQNCKTEQGGHTVTLNIPGHSQPTYNAKGRWPANVIHDGSEEVVGAFPESDHARGNIAPTKSGTGMWHTAVAEQAANSGDSGSAARFFYTAKADADDRIGSKHPTVKPVDLMQWLVRLVTPPGGTVLDPFSGTGTTGEAAFREGFKAILIEREEEYRADIRRRMRLCMAGPDERARESIKAKQGDKPVDLGPLFGGSEKTRGGGRQIYGHFADQDER